MKEMRFKSDLAIQHLIFFTMIFLCVYYFMMRFMVHDIFKTGPVVSGLLGLYFLYKYYHSFKFVLLDVYVFFFFLVCLYLFVFSVFNVGIEDSVNWFRIYVIPIVFYYSAKFLIVSRHEGYRSVSFIVFILLLSGGVYNTYQVIQYTFFSGLLPDWFISMNRNIEGWGGRAPGILAYPHASGLLSVMAFLYCYIYATTFRKKLIGASVKIICILMYLLSTSRTSVLAGFMVFCMILLVFMRSEIKIFVVTVSVSFSLFLILLSFVEMNSSLIIYFEVFFHWMASEDSVTSAVNYSIYESYDMLLQLIKNNAPAAILGIGAGAVSDHYNYIEFLKTNDQGYISLVQSMGMFGVLLIAAAIMASLRITYINRRMVVKEQPEVLGYMSIVLVVLLTCIHTPLYAYNGISQLFYVSLAVPSALFSRSKFIWEHVKLDRFPHPKHISNR